MTSLQSINVPVLKAIRLKDRSLAAWQVGEDGIRDSSVHYRLAMPEVQGVAQPFVVAAAGAPVLEPTTGLRIRPVQPIANEVGALARRIARLKTLREKTNAEKRVALVYYNHPPGRHNIGADNLDVPGSLLSILRHLNQAGYTTGPLPKDAAALLAQLQEKGVNLPEDDKALAAMAPKVNRLSGKAYTNYFRRCHPPHGWPWKRAPWTCWR